MPDAAVAVFVPFVGNRMYDRYVPGMFYLVYIQNGFQRRTWIVFKRPGRSCRRSDQVRYRVLRWREEECGGIAKRLGFGIMEDLEPEIQAQDFLCSERNAKFNALEEVA